ncbi:MAG: hypothetical protein ACD_52C00312G0002 [uncultured bacterium]|nr:MAG: hypothetical protein ACD_52C00312G0002 [uncultured bacterium]
MMNKEDLKDKLKLFGIEEKPILIYLTLLNKGLLTPLELSRETQLNRTSVYRYLEELKNLGLVEEVLDQKTTKFRAGDPKKLNLLYVQKEANLKAIQQNLPGLVKQLSSLEDTPSSSTKVVYFRGQSGLKQLLWNVVSKCQGEFVGYGYQSWNEGVGFEFAESLRQKAVERKIQSREISNAADEEDTFTKNTVWLHSLHQERVLSEKTLEIHHDTYIYNQIFAFYHFYQDELFGIEIHNTEIAKTQKQIFEILWKLAKPVKYRLDQT